MRPPLSVANMTHCNDYCIASLQPHVKSLRWCKRLVSF
jgi:hypothetical protein